MKILIYIHDMQSEAMRLLVPQVEFLDQKGAEVIILCHRKVEHEIQKHCKIIHFPWKVSLFKRKWRSFLFRHDFAFKERDLSFRAFLEVALKDLDPDIIHGHYAHETMRLFQNLPSIYKGKMIWHFHALGMDTLLRKRSFKKHLQIALNQSQTYGISESDFVIQQLKKQELSSFNIRRINAGIDPDVFNPVSTGNPVSTPGKTLVQITSNSPNMGHAYILRAIAKFIHKNPDQNIRYLYSADGIDHVDILKEIETLKLHPYCEAIDLAQKDQVINALVQADAFVYPRTSHKHTDDGEIPFELLEAMAMELPILTTKHGAIPEIVAHDVNGILVREKNIKALEKGIEEILTWPKIKRNRNKVMEHFNLKHQLENIFQLYQEILQK